MLVVVTGIDGCGKSTLVRRLGSAIDGVVTCHWSDAMRKLRMVGHPASLLRRLSPNTRALYIALLNSAVSEEIIEPARRRGAMVVCESYFVKFLAKERVYAESNQTLLEPLVTLPIPDLVLDVRLDPRRAFSRLEEGPNPYEVFGKGDEDDFVRFQSEVRIRMDEILGVMPCARVVLDGEATPDRLLYQSVASLQALDPTVTLGTSPMH